MQVSPFEPGSHGSLEARRRLQVIRAKLADGSAASSDFRIALEAMLYLPDDEGGRWLDEMRPAFAFVYARERRERRAAEARETKEKAGRTARDTDPLEACEGSSCEPPRT